MLGGHYAPKIVFHPLEDQRGPRASFSLTVRQLIGYRWLIIRTGRRGTLSTNSPWRVKVLWRGGTSCPLSKLFSSRVVFSAPCIYINKTFIIKYNFIINTMIQILNLFHLQKFFTIFKINPCSITFSSIFNKFCSNYWIN